MTRPPMTSLGISLSPELSSWRTIELMTRSTRSGSTGRLRSATWIERASLSRSKGSRCPPFLTTVSSGSSGGGGWRRDHRSDANPSPAYRRNRKMDSASSPPRGAAALSLAPARNPRARREEAGRRPAFLVSWQIGIDGKAGAEGVDLVADAPLRRFAVIAPRHRGLEHLDDHAADFAELLLAEAARRRRWRAEADARGDRRLLWVEGDAVLVAGDAGAPESRLGELAGQPLRPQIDQHEMRIRASRNDGEAALGERRRERPRIGENRARIVLEGRLQRLAEGDRLGGDGVHERPALEAGEDGAVDAGADLRILADDHAAARAAQGLVRRRRHDMGVRQRARIDAAGDEPGEMRHVHHEIGADLVGDPAEAREVDDPRIGGAAGDDELRPLFARQSLHFLEVDARVVAADAVGDDAEPFA